MATLLPVMCSRAPLLNRFSLNIFFLVPLFLLEWVLILSVFSFCLEGTCLVYTAHQAPFSPPTYHESFPPTSEQGVDPLCSSHLCGRDESINIGMILSSLSHHLSVIRSFFPLVFETHAAFHPGSWS